MKRVALLALAVGVLAAAGTATAAVPKELEQQWALAGGPALKILVRQTGWYRVTRKRLLASGLPADAAPRTYRLYVGGREVPISVRGGAIEFYGAAQRRPSTDTQVYWLAWGGNDGRRIPLVRARQKGGRLARSYVFTVLARKPSRYFPLTSDASLAGDGFYTALVTPGNPAKIDMPVVAPDPRSGRPVLEVRLAGYGEFPHVVRLTLNGTPVASSSFSGVRSNVVRAAVPRRVLKAGVNTLAVETLHGDTDFVLLDRASLTYSRLFRAREDQLSFRLAPRARARVTGFRLAPTRLIDVTAPSEPRLYSVVARNSYGRYALSVAASPGLRRLLAVSPAQVRAPASVVRDRPSTWHSSAAGADEVMIAYRAFAASVAPLVARREAQGLKVAVVDVEQLYDEFTFGVHDPQAIKDFLARARDVWRTPPRYALLVGDGSIDPRDYLGSHEIDFIPVKTLKTAVMVAPSDGWFGDFDNDGVPEIAVGRLPVQTADATANVVRKILSYESALVPVGPRSAFLVADENRGVNFSSVADGLRALLPPATNTESSYRDRSPSDGAFRAEVAQRLATGPDVVSYTGHGSVEVWGRGNWLPLAAARSLANEHPSLYVMTTCLNGYFIDPKRESLGEALLRARGGAAAVLSASGLVEAGGEIQFARDFFATLGPGRVATLGDAIRAAKAASPSADVRISGLLLGDPAMRIRL